MGQSENFSSQVAGLIAVLRQARRDNEQLYYYATLDKNRPGRSIMPVTPFVFEFFIYNSLYQVDWSASLQAGCVRNHPETFTETKQQSKLEKFLKPHIREEPALLYKAFLPIRDATLEGDWTAVVPDSRISAKDGECFFDRLRVLQTRLHNTNQPEQLQVNNSLFDLIGKCRWYVYLVRNNIFHGSKTLGETYEPKQRRRIEIYLTFLRCVTELFFSVCGKRLLRHDP